MEATRHAARHPIYRDGYRANKRRPSKQRGPKVAQVDIARRLVEAIWHVLTSNRSVAAARATSALAA